ncbi:MAG: FecR domain-containing protein [Gemmatimonadaceae bacterium]
MIDETDLVRLVDGSCSPETAVEIQHWVAADPRRAELLDELRAVWRLSGTTSSRWDLAAARTRLARARASLDERAAASGHRYATTGRVRTMDARRPARWSNVARYVGVGVAATTIAVAGALIATRKRPISYREFATTAGERAQLTLSDGSQVLLGSASRLRLPSDYGHTKRQVELDGEGYFIVAHDASRPFLVRSDRGVAEDLGTRFAVRDYHAERGDYRLVVAEGSVALRASAHVDSTVLTLRAGDVATIGADGMRAVSSGVAVERELAWTKGRLEFDDAPADSVIAALARWYGLQATLDEPSLRGERVTVALTTSSVDDALATLEKVLRVKVTRDGRSLRVTAGRRTAADE